MEMGTINGWLINAQMDYKVYPLTFQRIDGKMEVSYDKHRGAVLRLEIELDNIEKLDIHNCDIHIEGSQVVIDEVLPESLK
jgi:hypothetical protein